MSSPHARLPIYQRGCALLQVAFEIQQHMPRGQKRHLGEKIVGHCTDMVDLMASANASRGAQRAECIRTILQRVNTVETLLRVGAAGGNIKTPLWGRAVEQLEDVGRQGGGWLKSTAKAPAA